MAGRPTIDRVHLLDAAAEASFHSGDAARAVALGRQAVAAADGADDGAADPRRLAHLLGRLLEWSAGTGETEELGALGERAVELVPPDPPTVERAFALLTLASVRMHAGRHRECLGLALESARIAVACGAVRNEAGARSLVAVSLAGLGRDHEALEMIDRAVVLADSSHGTAEVGLAHINQAAVYSHAGRFADLPAVLASARAAVDREGLHDMSEPWLATDEVDLLVWQGRWGEAEALADRMIDAHPPPSPLAWHLLVRGQLRVRTGRLVEGERDLRAACDIRPPVEPEIRAVALGHLAEAALARTDPRGALVLADEALAVLATTDEVPGRAHLFALGLRTAADLAESARARRDAAGEAEAVGAAARYVAGVGAAQEGRLVEGGATEGRVASRVAWGLAEEGRRTGAPDPDAWAAAATALVEAGEPYLAAYCRYREAEAVLAGPGDRARADTILRETRTWAARVGAEPLRRDVASLARRARLDLADPPSPADAPPVGARRTAAPADPYRLSPRERDVLALLVEGRTNREIGATLFISEKTASSHVTHILDKLGVASRGAAAALAVRGGLVGGPEA